MAEILSHGQQLDLRTRRGADFSLVIQLWTDAGHTIPVDLTGATCVSRIFATGQADVVFDASIDGPAGSITIAVPAGRTQGMPQDWQYVLGYKLAGATTPLIFGAFRVAQESL